MTRQISSVDILGASGQRGLERSTHCRDLGFSDCGWWSFCREDLTDPHTAVVWDCRVVVDTRVCREDSKEPHTAGGILVSGHFLNV